jgi:hypothetical protein
MEDWSTSDYTRGDGGTFYVPEEDHDAGVYILDEPVRPARVYQSTVRMADPARVGVARGYKEGYYTGGNIISQDKNRERVFDTTWDERPERYNPNSGAEWARLVPNPRDRPYGGGPAPSLAFPMISQSEAMNKPDASVFPSAPAAGCAGREGFAVGPSISVANLLQIIKVVLLIIVAVLLAMSLRASGRIEDALEKLALSAAALT